MCVNAVNVTHACSGPPLPPFLFAQRGQAWLVPRGRWGVSLIGETQTREGSAGTAWSLGGEPDWRNTDSRRLNPP